MTLTQDDLKERLSYDPLTGIFIWKTAYQSRYIGKEAGSYHCDGYKHISIKKVLYLSHRLAFLYMEGSFPEEDTDHINRVRSDNRWCNLKRTTASDNNYNRGSFNSIVRGVHVYFDKWRARGDYIEGIREELGNFKTHLAACMARHQWEINNAKI